MRLRRHICLLDDDVVSQLTAFSFIYRECQRRKRSFSAILSVVFDFVFFL